MTVLTDDDLQMKPASYLLIIPRCSARHMVKLNLPMTTIKSRRQGIVPGTAKVSVGSSMKWKQPVTKIAAEEGVRRLDTGLANSASVYCKDNKPQSCDCYQVLPSRLSSHESHGGDGVRRNTSPTSSLLDSNNLYGQPLRTFR